VQRRERTQKVRKQTRKSEAEPADKKDAGREGIICQKRRAWVDTKTAIFPSLTMYKEGAKMQEEKKTEVKRGGRENWCIAITSQAPSRGEV